MKTQYLLQKEDNVRVPITEWGYMEMMGTKCYEHVIAEGSIVVIRRWRVL